MIEKIAAVVAAAIGTGFVVGAIPGGTPGVAVDASQNRNHGASDLVASNSKVSLPTASTVQMADRLNAQNSDRRSCVGTWPYYEISCLRDARQADHGARVVRIISVEPH